jgi:hypothetical protein
VQWLLTPRLYGRYLEQAGMLAGEALNVNDAGIPINRLLLPRQANQPQRLAKICARFVYQNTTSSSISQMPES